MLITSTWVLICATLAYKSTEKMEACCLHKFQEHCSSWVGTVVSEHYQKAHRKQYKDNLIHVVKNVWAKKKKKSFYINTVKTLSYLCAWNAQEIWWGRTAMETFFPVFFGKGNRERNFRPNWWVQCNTKSSLLELENIFSCWWDESMISCMGSLQIHHGLKTEN